MPLASPVALAQPVGGQVVAGAATITTPSLHSTLITQSSSKAIIDWQQFSLAKDQTVQFAQPDASAITLNRVTGGAMSTIAGSINANGQVWLINPNGVLFGSKALVNVGGLLATTSDIANGDFLSGNYSFSGAPSGSAVINKGTINASTGGSVVLSAPRVVNKGVITAHAGHVVLGSAKAFTVDFNGDHLLSYQVNTPAAQADGQVAMTERAAHKIQRDVVNDTGMAEATHARVENGEVILDGDGVASSGTVDVTAPKGQGGTVELQGKTVAVADGAKIDASGDSGGGTILIGGNFHGAGPQLNAQTTTVGKATIKADAVNNGNGGNIAIWSDGTTKVAAAISAKGGAAGGNGGQVETSGHVLQVDDATTVTTAAIRGTNGDWLLDPGTINISLTNPDTALDGSNNYTLADDPSTTDTKTISPTTITTALSSSSVTLQASNAINVVDDLTYNSSAALKLESQGSITIGANIKNTGSGAIALTAGWDGTTDIAGAAGAGTYGLTSGGTVSINGSAVQVGTGSGTTYINAYGLTLQTSGGGNYAQLGYHDQDTSGGNFNVQTLAGGVALNGLNGGVAQIGNGGYDGGNQQRAVGGNISITTTGATTVYATNLGTAKIGNYAQSNDHAGNVTLVTGTLTNGGGDTAYGVDQLIFDNIGNTGNITGGNVTVGATSALTISSGVSYTSDKNVVILSTGALQFSNAGVQNNGTGSITVTGGWDGVSTAGGTAAGGTFGNGGFGVSVQGNAAAIGSKSGATYVNGASLFVQDGTATATYAQVGYHGDGGGAINIQTTSGGITLQESYGNYAFIGNGSYTAAGITAAATGDITINSKGTIAVNTTGGTARIGNHGYTYGQSGNILLTGNLLTSTGTTYDVNTLINDNIGSSNTSGGDVSATLNGTAGATNLTALAGYNSPHNVTFTTNNGITLSGGVNNAGTGSLSLAAGVAFSSASNIHLNGNLNASTSNGDLSLTGILTIGGTTALSSSAGFVTATNTGNILTGAVSAAAYGGSFGGTSAIDIRNSTSLTLGNVTVANSGASADYGAVNIVTNSTNGAGNITLTGSVAGGGITLNAAGVLSESGAGAITSHKAAASGQPGGLALTAGGNLTLTGTNTIEQLNDGSNVTPGQLVLSAGGSAAMAVTGGNVALYGATAGSTLGLTLTGTYVLNTSTLYDSLDIYNPVTAGDRVTLTVDGTITQKVDPTRSVAITTPVGLTVTSSHGNLVINDTGNGINAGNVTNGQVIDAGNNIGGTDSGSNSQGGTTGGTNVNGYTVLNAPAGSAVFGNTRDTILGGPAYYNSPNVPNYVYVGTPTALPNNYTSPDSYIFNTLSVNITDGHQPSGHSALILAGRIHAQNRGSTDNYTFLQAAGNIENNAGSGTIIVGNSGNANNLWLSSTNGDIGVNDGSNWSFGLGVDTGVLNLKATAANQITLNPGAINFGIHNQSGPAISTTGGLLIFGNGTVTQSTGFSGYLQISGDMDVHANGAITLDNPQNAVSGTAFFRTSSSVTYNNSVNTTVGRANAGGLDGNNQPNKATNVTITVADPNDATTPTLTLGNNNDQIGNTNTFVATSIDASGAVILSAFGGVTDNYTNTISSAGHVSSGVLTVTAARQGDISLTNPVNAISGLTILTATQGNVALANSIATLIGTSTAGGTLKIVSAGNLTIDTNTTLTAGGSGDGALVLAATGTSAFINNAGSGALSVQNGGWQIYSNNAAGDTFGGLDSANSAVWNSTYAGGIDSNANPGNRYVFVTSPTFTVTTTNVTKQNAGDDATATVAGAYTVSGLQGVTGAFQDSYSGTPSVTSAGSAPSNDPPGTNYTITAASGSLVLPTGYSLSFSNAGILNIAGNAGPLPFLTYVANPFSRAYGSANPVFTGTVTGFRGNDNQQNSTTGTAVWTSTATASSGVGSYAINGSGLSSNSYQFQQAASNATALTINAALLSYVAGTNSKTYGAPNPFLTGTVTGFVNGDTQASATTGTLAFSSPATTTDGVGSYAVNGFGLSANNYVFTQAAGNSTALTINPATLSYVASAASKTYGAANPVLAGTVTGFVNGDTEAGATTGTLAFSSSATASSGVGKYAISGSGLAAKNYVFVQASGNSTALTVNPATLSYVANAASAVYGAANPAFSGTVSGFVNGDTQSSATTGTLNFSSSATTLSGVGTYAVNGSGLLARNYVFAQAAGNGTAFSVTPATLTYIANATQKTYGASNPVFGGTVSGFVNGDTQSGATTGALAFNSSATALSGVGSYAINGSGLSARNYVFVQAAGNGTALGINPATLTYIASAAQKTYGAANPAFSGTVSGFVNGDTQSSATAGTLVFNSSATTLSGVGSYAINGSGLSARNYVFVQAAANGSALSINPATLIYAANANSRAYGAASPALSGTVSGFVNGDTQSSATTGTLLFSSGATVASGVGTYAVNGSGLASGNYVFRQAQANATALTITPATLTAALTGTVSKVFDGTATATLTSANYMALSGVVNGDSVSLSSLPTTGTFDTAAAGTQKIVTVSGLSLAGAGSANYTLASSSISAAIGIITAPVTTPSTQALTSANPVLLSVTVTLPQASPVLQANIITTNFLTNSTTSLPAPTQAPAVQIASLTAPNPIETLSADAANPQGAEPPAPADTATNYIIDSMNGSGSGAGTNVIIPGVLRAAGNTPPPPPGTGDNLSAWGNSSLWQ